MSKLVILTVLLLVAISNVQSQGCLNPDGEPVSWWVILKVPPMIGNSGYGYYDSNSKNGQFQIINSKVDAEGSPLIRTFELINRETL